MGLVYRAYHPQLDRTCAVKVLHAITPDADTAARFRREAQAIARLRHPNILDVYDFGEYQGTPYMIVEYVSGGSLADRLAKRVLDQVTAISFLRGIAAGLDYAHTNGVVHRDVKPANVLLTTSDTPVLADFGLAKLMQGSSLKSMTGVTTGTPAYMAPEQVTGSHVGPAADRYALASIGYEMLTGVIPFDGEALLELLYAQVHREPVKPSSRNPLLSPAVDAVVMRGLAKDPAARWPSCAAFVEALAAALSGKSSDPSILTTMPLSAVVDSTVPLGRIAPATPPAPPALVNPQSPPDVVPALVVPPNAVPAKKRRFPKRLAIGAGVLVILLIFAVLVNVAANPEITLTLSSSTVAPGASLVITGSNAPANQAGEIQLWATNMRTFPFQSDANGDVAVTIVVPRDIGAGDHLVKMCWAGACHAQATLKVIAAAATPTPSRIATPSVTPSPTRALVAPSAVKVKTGTITVTGRNFTPAANVTVAFTQGATTTVEKTTPAAADGTFSVTFTIPPWAVAGQPAQIRACDAACAFATVQVTA
jgi:serine/threonine protein kinase